MKNVWNSFKMAFALYSRIPMPNIQWTEENMSYVLCFFPWVGCVIGGMNLGLFYVQNYLNEMGVLFPTFFYTVLFVCIPLTITGGIHMDGFLDTKDALASYQSKERRLEILKDPHTGAFAVISGSTYLLASLAVYSAVSHESIKVISLGFMLSRTLSGISVIVFPQARKQGMAAEVSQNAQKRWTRNILYGYAIVLCLGLLSIGGVCGAAACIAAFFVFFDYKQMAMKNFGGVTGDLAGYFLQRSELWMAGAAVMTDIILKGIG